MNGVYIGWPHHGIIAVNFDLLMAPETVKDVTMKLNITDRSVEDVLCELELARQSYAEFASLHEGYAIILEELDELWDEVKKKPKTRDLQKVRSEAVQVAAMAIRMIQELDTGSLNNGPAFIPYFDGEDNGERMPGSGAV